MRPDARHVRVLLHRHGAGPDVVHAHPADASANVQRGQTESRSQDGDRRAIGRTGTLAAVGVARTCGRSDATGFGRRRFGTVQKDLHEPTRERQVIDIDPLNCYVLEFKPMIMQTQRTDCS